MRNLNSFGHLRAIEGETIAKQTTHVLSDNEIDRLELQKLVEMPGWQVLKRHFKAHAEKAAIPNTVPQLIGYLASSIIRDTTEALVAKIESEAKLAPKEWDID